MPNPIVIAALIAGAGILYKLFTEDFERGSPESMPDCNRMLTNFHNNHVKLKRDRWEELKSHGANAFDRVVKGLQNNGKPSPSEEPVLQGSFGMHTVVQPHPSNPKEHYDIDLGIVFARDDLVGDRGGRMSPLDVRKMVLDALGDDARFTSKPELKTNCVRVHYSDHHVDIPSYRHADNDTDAPYELASNDWKSSNPRAVTKWFNNAVTAMSPDDSNAQQLRRIVRLLKYYSRSRTSWNSPSGLIISKLVVECFPNGGFLNRDDVALYVTMHCIFERLKESLQVKHPVLDEYITKTEEDPCMVDFMKNLGKTLEDLQVIFEDDATKIACRKAWKKVFCHSFFDEDDTNESSNSNGSLGIAKETPNKAVKRDDDKNRYG